MKCVQGGEEIPAKEAGEPVMPYHLMSDNIPCILRRRDIVHHQVDRPAPVGTLGRLLKGLLGKLNR